jgi:hypothetical protein
VTGYDVWKTSAPDTDDEDERDFDDEADYWNWVDNLVDDAREREMERGDA